MKKIMAIGLASVCGLGASADLLRVDSFDHYGPFPLQTPVMVDSLDVNGKAFTDESLSSAPSSLLLPGVPVKTGPTVNAPSHATPAVHILSFNFENASYATPELSVSGIGNYAVYLDGKKTDSNKLTLRPATHNIAIRYISTPGSCGDSLKVELRNDGNAGLALRTDGKRRFTLDDVLHGSRITSASISPDGKYMIAAYVTTRRGGASSQIYKVVGLTDGTSVAQTSNPIRWLPTGSRYYFTRDNVDGRELVAIDASTGVENVVAQVLPDNAWPTVTPDEKSVILVSSQEGRKEDSGVYQVLEPEDRQPGWRNRSSISVLDIASGVVRPLTFGNCNVYLNDISDDSGKILFSTTKSRLDKRPTTVMSLYSLDIKTMSVDTIVVSDGFIGQAKFSPDAGKVIVAGSPEALGGIGKNLPEGRIPSMVDNQLFLIDIASGDIRPLTRDFNPSVSGFSWSRADGMVYFNAEDRDKVNLFRLDPASGKATRINVPEENVGGFSVADNGRTMIWYGESASSPLSLYSLDTKTLKSRLIDRPKAERLENVQLGKCEAWDFVNSRGDSICGRFYLPPDFDPSKKYPLIVNYYGGCSPTSRNFESRYPHNAYAAQGYVVYVIQPSGATGFGQEFSSRHVNTAGEGVAQDIIEGTKKFCRQHPYVDDKKIGCIGASYGGFMTQYLQTVTDIFAAAISHAGISDHTSYWGEGYWGYSYSEVSMAESYPWSNPDLFVKQSPLYNADKIHTPLLFLHGDKDNNVPVGESIQMFTALKLLNRPTAFVAVADQDHHILDYDKRIKWQDTIFAWFARYLKDDPSWWDAMYPSTPL
ncbi:MAG: prolyl oligopeptidase family serine peptidase [Muribaculaceae bacterium]|nr:prolyl oligopeptidase family serine peptidase [Muribaculaceae bacterium]